MKKYFLTVFSFFLLFSLIPQNSYAGFTVGNVNELCDWLQAHHRELILRDNNEEQVYLFYLEGVIQSICENKDPLRPRIRQHLLNILEHKFNP